MERRSLFIDRRNYRIQVVRQIEQPREIPRIVIPAFLPNDSAVNILKTCIKAIKKNTKSEEYELWVIDNCSPAKYSNWLNREKGINIAFCRTQPLPPERRTFFNSFCFWRSQKEWGSYANAVGLEIGIRLINQDAKFLITLHMDTMVCQPDWIKSFSEKMCKNIKAVGVCLERVRFPEGVLHVLGYMVDYQKFKELKIDFFPELPMLDVGDKTTLALRAAGYEVKSFSNTYENPESILKISPNDPFKELTVMRVFDDMGRVMFMHLGRGIRKSDKTYLGPSASAEEWIKFAEKYVIA